jgi:exodeoxyribonuclease VII large subunit
MATPTGPGLPERALDTSAEHPWPVRVLALKITDYVEKMAPLWVEGEVIQLSRRGATAYLTVRDPEVDMSLSVTMSTYALDAMPTAPAPGARVVLHAKAVFWPRRGTLHLEARQIRPVGVGDLLARIDILRRRLADEGLFDASRKQRLPFVPRGVGLITGRGSAAEHDVVATATTRWPAVHIVRRAVAVQGASAVTEICAALADLDRDPQIDVIIIARGGGATEELLPFSNETLLRAVASAATPVVSAIGHEADTPLLDLVADVRASTPTDAGRRVVPDATSERRLVAGLAERLASRVRRAVADRRQEIQQLRHRPVLRDRGAVLAIHRGIVDTARSASRRALVTTVERERLRIEHLGRQGLALSPGSVLARGFALVEHGDRRVVRSRAELAPGQLLRVVVADGDFGVRVVGEGSG